MDNSVDSLDEAIKLYVTKLTRGSLDEREGQRAMEIVSFAINLEHIGDNIDKNLSELATKKIKRRFQFSAEGAEELSAFHKRTMDRFGSRSASSCPVTSTRRESSWPRRPRCAMPNWPPIDRRRTMSARCRHRRPAAPDHRSSVFDALPRCLTISMMFLM